MGIDLSKLFRDRIDINAPEEPMTEEERHAYAAFGAVGASPDDGFARIVAYAVKQNIPFRRVGSSMIDGVAYPGDFDILVYDESGVMGPLIRKQDAFYMGGSEVPGSKFMSYKSTGPTPYNFIVTNDKKYYDTFLDAQSICEDKKIVSKTQRIKVFDFMMDRPNAISQEEFVEIITNPSKEADPVMFAVPF